MAKENKSNRNEVTANPETPVEMKGGLVLQNQQSDANESGEHAVVKNTALPEAETLPVAETWAPPEAENDLYHVKNFLDFYDLPGLKNYLQSLSGEVAAISSNLRKEMEEQVGTLSFEKFGWSAEDYADTIIKLAGEGNLVEAMLFISENEQQILELWVETLLEKHRYEQAGSLIHDYAKTNPGGRMSAAELDQETGVDSEILSDVLHRAREEWNIKALELSRAYDRVWAAMHRGCYEQAAEMCSALDPVKFAGKDQQISEVSTETPDEISERHAVEFVQSLPKGVEAMKTAFRDFPELMDRFRHLSQIGEKDSDHKFSQALQGQFQLFLDQLFNNGKIVVQQKGLVDVQEDIFNILEDLGHLGMRLYVDRNGQDNNLYLKDDSEVTDDDFLVDVSDLKPKDIVLDSQYFTNVTEKTQKPAIPGKTTLALSETYVWHDKVLPITPSKARQLRNVA